MPALLVSLWAISGSHVSRRQLPALVVLAHGYILSRPFRVAPFIHVGHTFLTEDGATLAFGKGSVKIRPCQRTLPRIGQARGV